MILIAETKQENALVEQLAKENHATAWRREDSYAIVRWSIEDVLGVKPELNKEGAEAFLEYYESNITNLITGDGFQTLEEMDASDFVENEEEEDEEDEEDDCPLGGDITNDCEGCPCSGDYHFYNGECVARGSEHTVCDRGGDNRDDCKHCAAGLLNHCVNGKCTEREENLSDE